MNSTIEEIMNTIYKANNVVIAGHVSPDGDAIGSSLALALSLSKMGKKVTVLLETYNSKFNIIPGSQFVYKGKYDVVQPEVFIALDCGSKDRLGAAGEVFDRSPITINVDHHVSNNNYAQLNYVNVEYSSTCEVLFGFISRYVTIDEDIATALYTGIVFDTGGFRHGCTHPRTHLSVAKLMEWQIPFTDIINEMMYRHSYSEAKAFAKAVENMQVMEDYPVAYGYISADMLKEIGATPKDMDGIVEYYLNTRGIEVSIFAYEKTSGETKISFRSSGPDVNQVAGIFGGGGHKLAAGCTIFADPITAMNKAIEEVRKAFRDNA